MKNKKDHTVATFDEWIAIGLEQNWCGPPVCSTHDGIPMSSTEDDEFVDGGDPCIHVIRLYESTEHAAEVAEAHAPTQWRRPQETR